MRPTSKNSDLHGSVPQRSRVALVLIDVINAMDFPGGEKLAKSAFPAARRIAKLKAKAKASRVPVIYANDNFGRWRSDFRATVENARRTEMPGREIAAVLTPQEDDYFVLKPKHSAFYGTSLDLLLRYLGSDTLVLAGFAGDICVQFTAQDAFMRDFHVLVASDCIASEDARRNAGAIKFMKQRLGMTARASARIDFAALRRVSRDG